jgi:hypothetical protein
MITPMVYSNPHNVNGMYSAGKLTTNTSPNYSQYPNRLPSTNMYIAGAKKSKRRKFIRSRRYKPKYNKSMRRKKYIHTIKKTKKKYFSGGNVNAFNAPIAFGYGVDGSALSSTESMLANPIPYKPYFACNKV